MNYARMFNRFMQARLFRSTGFPRTEPMSLAVSVTSRCMARCRTCNVTASSYEELTVAEYEAIFRNLRDTPLWVTITGGEPFLREDLPDILDALCRKASPDYVSIPTNGYLDSVPRMVQKAAKSAPRTRFIAHVSIDGIGRAHDELRGLPDSFERALDTFSRLRALALPNVAVGIHTTISRYNADRIPDIVKYIREFKPDMHHFEIAWPRRELNMDDADITPTPEQYTAAVQFLQSAEGPDRRGGMKNLLRTFREEYYRMSVETLASERQVVPCCAGFVSAHIAPDGTVWACCTTGAPFGNLRDTDYRFRRVWNSRAADAARADIRDGKCWCLLANAAYTSLICRHSIPGLWVMRNFMSAGNSDRKKTPEKKEQKEKANV